VVGLLSWGSSIRPFADTLSSASTPAWAVAQTSARDCHVPCSFRSCRSSRLQRFPPQRMDPRTHPSTDRGFVAPRSRPWGSPSFKFPEKPFGFPRPGGRRPEGPMKPSPMAKTLRSFLLPGSPRPVRHGTVLVRPLLRETFGVVAYTGWRALSSFAARPLSCCHDALRAAPTSGLCSTEELVAATQRFRCAPLDAPMGFGSTRSDAAARFRAAQTSWAFARE